ncbi:hypothetical protein ACIOJ8_37180, partial [Streptomyces sp. NPDC087864]
TDPPTTDPTDPPTTDPTDPPTTDPTDPPTTDPTDPPTTDPTDPPTTDPTDPPTTDPGTDPTTEPSPDPTSGNADADQGGADQGDAHKGGMVEQISVSDTVTPAGSLAHTGADGNTTLAATAGGLLAAGLATVGAVGYGKRRADRHSADHA